ncbi:uncharacterized protein LOC121663488 isoform X5 [Corvus kubaryi]|uniref:uncharacterized protein LOC121663488 isoform X5 n=1 Tax=Corvus kubaryi TaxID=68294 RepID=UPI001C04D960|nr:uncharacterized protein LOC121663488 isoform X5 [Corvus kubaryi]
MVSMQSCCPGSSAALPWRVNLEKRTQEAGTEDMAGRFVRKIFKSIGVGLAACEIIYRAVKWILERRREREREKTTKLLDSKLNENFLYLMKQMEPLKRVFKKLHKFKLCDLQVFRADLEKIQEKKEEEIARALESRLMKKFHHLSQSIQTLQEDVHEWLESTKLDLQVLRADLEKIHGNKEEEIARALESWMEKVFQHLSQIIQTPEEALEEIQTPEEALRKRKGF